MRYYSYYMDLNSNVKTQVYFVNVQVDPSGGSLTYLADLWLEETDGRPLFVIAGGKAFEVHPLRFSTDR